MTRSDGPSPPAASLQPNRLERVMVIAQGGMGVVELALRLEGSFRRLYAVKRPLAAHRDDPAFRAMFLDEARLAGLLRHPNVVSVLDVGEDGDGPFMVMDYVEGLSLGKILERAPAKPALLPVAFGVTVAAQLARGLHAAHELKAPDGTALGLVHRDISPQNVLVGFDGVARLTDFGIAKALGNLNRTTTGVLKGNVGYMAPELLRFREPDRRSDLFSLGVVLYEALSRQRLFHEEDSGKTARRILEEPAPDILEVRLDIPAPLAELLFRLLAKDPADRPADAQVVAQTLEDVAALLQWQERPFDIAAHMAAHYGTLRRDEEVAIAAAITRTEQRVAAGASTAALGDLQVAPHEATSALPVKTRRPLRLAATVVGLAMLTTAGVWALGGLRVRGRLEDGPTGGGPWLGAWHACAARGRDLLCWGKNAEGNLGDGTTVNRSKPYHVEGVSDVAAVAGGQYHTCAVQASGRVWCWGSNRAGQIAAEAGVARTLTPRSVPGLNDATAVTAGQSHTCVLRRTGRVLCFGDNSRGQLGTVDGPASFALREVPGLSRVVRVAAGGGNTTCALHDDGGVSCWGDNEAGQLGVDGPPARASAARVPGAAGMVELAVGRACACTVDRAGRVWCWGENGAGQLGSGSPGGHRNVPAPVTALGGVAAVSGWGSFFCARLTAGGVRCWGRGDWGNLGDGHDPGKPRSSALPVAVLDVADAVTLGVGSNFACVRHATGALSCWGLNESNQLGEGTAVNRARPVSVAGF